MSSHGEVNSTLLAQDVRLHLKRLTDWPGGLQDRRPGYQGLIKSPAYLVFQEFATRLNYTNVQVGDEPDS